MSKFKAGASGTLIIFAVVVVILTSVIIVNFLQSANIIELKQTVFITNEIDSKGTAINSILVSTAPSGKKYIEVLISEDQEDLKQVLDNVYEFRYHLTVSYADKDIELGSQPPSNFIETTTEIPFPGAVDSFKVKVRIKTW